MNKSRDPHLLTTGAFARITQLSLKALRLYDQLGILKPFEVDAWNGYRYYHPDQVSTARLVRSMRQMDMPLAVIRAALVGRPEDLPRLVEEYLGTLEKKLAKARQIAPLLTQLIQPKEPDMSFEIEVSDIPTQYVFSITAHVYVKDLDQTILKNLKSMYGLLAAQGKAPQGPPFGIYHGPINAEENGPIEICLPVEPTATAELGATLRMIPAMRVASTTLVGAQCDFPAILQAYDAVCDWILQNGYATQDAPREIWLSGEDPMQMRVEWAFV